MAGPGRKKKYEPPVVKEIGGVYEQARGVSNCATGTYFAPDPCSAGLTPGGTTGCSGGVIDQGCMSGASDTGGCSRGVTVA